MNDDAPLDPTDPRAAAIARLKARRNLSYQAVSYLVISIFLVIVWAIGDRGFFWPIFPMLGFALAIFGQWRAISLNKPITEDDIRREMGRG